MKAAQIDRYGGSEVVKIKQNAPPPPKPSTDKILVGIKAAGVNPVDWKIREGHMQQMIHLQFPSTLGMDFSGVINQVGEGQEGREISTDFRQGDEVYGQAAVPSGGSGAFAEIALTKADRIARKPKSLNHVEAAALPLVGVSAWQALVENMNLSKGQRILIHGGAGGIGSIAIQLAKSLGAYVATTVSADDKQFVQDLGADEIIDYKIQAFEYVLREYDAVFDTVGGDTYTKSFNVLKKGNGGNGGIIVSMLEQPNKNLMERFGVKAIFLFTQVNRERLTQLGQLADQNKIKVHVDKTFPLGDAAKALDYVKDIHPRGKVVLEI
ncbi:MAG: NADP-dependent oxidoreductase [Candidatus Nitrosocosmicus sp.]